MSKQTDWNIILLLFTGVILGNVAALDKNEHGLVYASQENIIAHTVKQVESGTFIVWAFEGNPHLLAKVILSERDVPRLRSSIEFGNVILGTSCYVYPTYPVIYNRVFIMMGGRTGEMEGLLLESVTDFTNANFQEWTVTLQQTQHMVIHVYNDVGEELANGEVQVKPEIVNMVISAINQANAALKAIPADQQNFKMAAQAFFYDHPEPFLFDAETQKTSDEQPKTLDKFSPQQFFEAFLTAVQTSNTPRIQQLITANPTSAKEVYQELRHLGEGVGEEATQSLALALILASFFPEESETPVEMSPEQFFEAFSAALQTYDIEQIHQLITTNPNTVEQVLQRLAELGQGAEENADFYLILAEELGKFRSGDFTWTLQSLQDEGEQAYFLSDYLTALEKWQMGLKLSRHAAHKGYMGQFLYNIGRVHDTLNQYQQALDSYQQALPILREIGDRRTEGYTLNNIGLTYKKLGQYQQALDYYRQSLAIKREIGDKQGEGYTLNNLGNVYGDLEQYQQALEYYEQALVVKREIGDRQGEGTTLGNIGGTYAKLEKYQQALESLEQALTIRRAIGDRQGEGRDLTNLGEVYDGLEQYEQALEYYKQALSIVREFDDRPGEGDILLNIGAMYGNQGQYKQALEYLEQSLVIQREIGNRYKEGEVLANIAKVYEKIGEYQQALESYKQVLAIHREVGDRQNEGNDLTSIGGLYWNLGQYQQALDSHKQELVIWRELGNHREEGSTLTNMGVVYENLEQYQLALEYHEQALAIHRETGNRQEEGRGLTNLSAVYAKLGQYEQALKYGEQALTIHREFGDQDGQALTLSNLGIVYDHRGQYEQALGYYHQALTILRKIRDHKGEGATLLNLGGLYRDLGQYKEALVYYLQALVIKEELSELRGKSGALSGIGAVYWHLGEYDEALKYFMQALQISHEISNHYGEGVELINIGAIYLSLGQYKQALEYEEQALVIMRELGERRAEGATLSNIGVVYENIGQYHEASTAFQKSLSISEALDATDIVWRTQRGLAAVEIQLNQLEPAIKHYEQALDTIDTLRAEVAEKELKLSFMQNKLFVYDELIRVLQDLYLKYSDKGYERKALETFERKQGRMFLEEMGQSGARLFAGIPKVITQKELNLGFQLEHIRKQVTDERSQPITEQNKALIHTLEKTEKTLMTEQNTLQEQIKTAYPDYYALKYPKPASLADLQQKVLQAHELMLVYSVMKENTIVWLISPRMMKMYTLPVGEEALQEKVAELQRGMELEWKRIRGEFFSPEQDADPQNTQRKVVIFGTPKEQKETKTFAQISYELFTLLFPEEVRPLLTEEHTLSIVLTGPLYALPFEALVTFPLHVGEGAVRYLIEDIPISYLSSASLLKTLREAQARRKATASYPLLAFAHPVYEPTPTPSQEGNNTSLRPPQGGNVSIQSLRSQAYHEFLRRDFQELPETAEEVRAIAQLLNAPSESEPLQLRENASCDRVFRFNAEERLDDYQYLVFATHGVLPGEVDQITQPALVLSHPDKQGYLTMADVFQLQLNAKLVSLSACNTGSGEQVRGEGVMGLTRAFMYAGTPAIAVTLWSVETFSAKALDVGLFEHLKAGQSPIHALRSIKLQMLRGEKGEEYTHPYYWAPFVLFGDGVENIKEDKHISQGERSKKDSPPKSVLSPTSKPIATPTPTSMPIEEDVGEDLIKAVKSGDLIQVQILLEKGTDVNAKDNNDKTALMWAASKGYTDVVKILLDNGTSVNMKTRVGGKTALQYATDKGHTEIIRLLRRAGARE